MGTQVHVVLVGPGGEAALDRAEARIHDLERRWSRFRPDSEISALNAAGGKARLVSADTYNVIELAVQAWEATGGSFDPTVLPALRALGYDRPFDEIAFDEVGAHARAANPQPAPGCAGVHLDPATRLVALPAGTELDLGGIGKGAAADLLVGELLASGVAGASVAVGGDVRVEGEPPSARGWIIDIRDAAGAPPVCSISLASGAACTSTTRKRRWTTDRGVAHHLVDPRTGRPIASGVATVTVVGARAVQAEVLTKVAFLAGADDAPAALAPYGVSARLVLDDGSVVVVGDLEEMAA
jgi:thiamine biosynthesis lipoprotein